MERTTTDRENDMTGIAYIWTDELEVTSADCFAAKDQTAAGLSEARDARIANAREAYYSKITEVRAAETRRIIAEEDRAFVAFAKENGYTVLPWKGSAAKTVEK